jgi:hypothetical protein
MSAFQSLSAGDSTPESRARAQRLVRAMVGKTLGYFETHDTDSVKHLRGHLLDLADGKVATLQSQNLRVAAMLLERQAPVFLKAYRQQLQSTLNDEVVNLLPGAASAPSPQASTDALDGLSLSLVDVDEVHRILLLDRVAQRFNLHYEPQLTALSQQLAVLMQQDGPALALNPFRPLTLLKGFISGWEKSGLDPQVTEHLADALEPAHFTPLAPLYGDLLILLTQAGVRAAPLHRIRKAADHPSQYAALSGPATLSPSSGPAPLTQPASSKAASVHAANHDVAASGFASGWAPAGRELVQQVRSFLQRLGVGRPADAANGAFAFSQGQEEGKGASAEMAIPADPALLDYLGAMQSGSGHGSQFSWLNAEARGPEQENHRNVLRELRQQPAFQGAQDIDRGTLEALAEVFDYVFADVAIPAELKVVIGRMQIPVLRAAMMDRDFFLSAEHPARKLVDTLASASVAWTPEKGEQDPLFLRIESTVQQVLEQFSDDLTLFSTLLAEFTEFLFECEQQAQQQIDPVAAQEHDHEQLQAALTHADEIIHARIAALPEHLPLAPFLAPFLTTQWRMVIAKAWLTEDAHAGHWNQTLDTMDRLIWSTQPKTGSEERQTLVSVLPELVRVLNAELDGIGWEGEDRNNFTRRLIATHMMAIRMKAATALDTQGAALEARASDEAMQALDERRAQQLAAQDASVMDDFDSSAQLLTRGVWFEKISPGTAPFRCRLSWVSPMRTRFLFTNREGFDAFVRSEREVAEMLRRGELCMLDQAPIVERALNRLMADNEPALRLQA